MDFAFSKDELAFRDEVRSFIDKAFDAEMRAATAKSRTGFMTRDLHIRWQKRLYEKGWMVPNWPKEHGGPGWTHVQRYIYDQEMTLAGAPAPIAFGPRMLAPVLMKFGTEQQKRFHLPAILKSDIWWAQGYSEPGSGSDLASLQLKCEDKGDHFLLNGSKIWTSYAQHADWIFCLVRTEKLPRPQEGISFVLCDMKTPGVKVDPIITIDAPVAPFQEVNQVFFTDVKIPKENLVGEWNKGWTCAKYLLEFERGNPYSGGLKRGLEKVRKIAKAETADGQPLIQDQSFARRLAQIETEVMAQEFTELRLFGRLKAGQNMGAESSLLKMRGTELQQAVTELAMDAAGYYKVPFTPYVPGRNEESPVPEYSDGVAQKFLNTRKTSIYAGSNEIQRNIMAKAILGL